MLSIRAYDAAGHNSHPRSRSVRTLQCALGHNAPPPSTPTCTKTTNNPDLASAIQKASAGTTICLASGSYGDLSLTSVGKTTDVTLQPAPGATVTLGRLTLRMVHHLRFTGIGGSLSVAGLELDPVVGDPTWSHNLTFDHLIWTGASNVRTFGTYQTLLFDHDVFDNLGTGAWEGRITVAGDGQTLPVGVTISNSHFAGGCSDGVHVTGGAYGVQIGPGNEFTGIQQSGCAPVHADPIQLYHAVGTFVTGNYFHDNGDGSGGLESFSGDGPATVTDNVFVCSCLYPFSIAAFGGHGWLVVHNTFVGGLVRFQSTDSGIKPSRNIVLDNLWLGGGLSTTTSDWGTNEHNLNSGHPGFGNRKGTPIFVGGKNPNTYVGYRLAPRSPGKDAASDGGDMGISGIQLPHS
jgi:hypothetical protein